MKKIIFNFFVFALIFSSCNNDIPGVDPKILRETKIFSQNLILGYHDVNGIYIDSFFAVYHYPPVLPISINSKNAYFHKEIAFNYVKNKKAKKQEKSEFDKLSAKNNDVNFQKEILWLTSYYHPNERNHVSTKQDFTSISVKSDKDFDEKHPAGSELGDLIYFGGNEFSSFINNDYKPVKSDSIPAEVQACRVDSSFDLSVSSVVDNFLVTNKLASVVFKKVSELKPEDLKKLSIFETNYKNFTLFSIGKLFFVTPPTKSKSHTFTIRLTTDEGEVFEGKGLVDF